MSYHDEREKLARLEEERDEHVARAESQLQALEPDTALVNATLALVFQSQVAEQNRVIMRMTG